MQLSVIRQEKLSKITRGFNQYTFFFRKTFESIVDKNMSLFKEIHHKLQKHG